MPTPSANRLASCINETWKYKNSTVIHRVTVLHNFNAGLSPFVFEISGSCYSMDWNIFYQLFTSFEFKERINETLKIKELFIKFAHNFKIYSVKITVYIMYNIYNSNALLLTDSFLFHKSMFYEQWTSCHSMNYNGHWNILTLQDYQERQWISILNSFIH
jgi:hypothetical protein